MDLLAFTRKDAKVVPTQSEEHQQRDEGLPVGSVHTLHQRPQAEPPSQQREEVNEEHQVQRQSVDPYSQPFTIEAALSLSLDDQFVPWYLQGYDLFMETRTSKYRTNPHTIINQEKERFISTLYRHTYVVPRRAFVPLLKDEPTKGTRNNNL